MKANIVVPITERSNVITRDIDKANAKEIVRSLYKCDLEVFNGFDGYKNVLSSEILNQLHDVSTFAAQCLKSDAQNAGIILSGCGTSGRIAFFISRMFNEFAKEQNLRPCYKYIISGGDHALMTSVESCEDNWNAGKRDLEKAAEGLDKILYVGITCGLSAPFIGGQVEYCLQHLEKFVPYLLGFNPANQARNVPISGTDKTMLDIVLEMQVKGHLLNPVVGPEPITGSSRMQGGTATKMLLETIFYAAHQLASNQTMLIVYDTIIKAYKTTLDLTYSKETEISYLIETAGNSLIQGGYVSYIGWGSLGIMGMIDAAECVPTFGASHDDIRCFIEGGYKFLRNAQGDLSGEVDALEISLDYFIEQRCPKLSENDTVIFIIQNLSSDEKLTLSRIAELVKKQNVNLALITIISDNNEIRQVQDILGHPLTIHIVLPSSTRAKNPPHNDYNKYQKFLEQCIAEVSFKWVINAVSTGAHILKGKVLKNYMIDLKLTNRKLFERGVSIVASFGNVNSEKAKECLLKSIYRQDELNSAIATAEISEYVQKAGYVEKVIPLALLMTKGFNIISGLKMLEDCPIVRQCIENCI